MSNTTDAERFRGLKVIEDTESDFDICWPINVCCAETMGRGGTNRSGQKEAKCREPFVLYEPDLSPFYQF